MPQGRWLAVTLLATPTRTGLGPGLQLEGSVNRLAFDTFVAQALVPILRPGHVVVLDNLSVHKSAAAQHTIEATGAILQFLPTYSLDFKPIEQAFSQLKHHVRAVHARTVETVMAATTELYPRITAIDAATITAMRTTTYDAALRGRTGFSEPTQNPVLG